MSSESHVVSCINTAALHYNQCDYTGAFIIATDALRVDPYHLKAQIVSVASLTKIETGLLDRFIGIWSAICRFGTLENAAAILSEVFAECDGTYDLFAGLAILSLRMGYPEMSMRMFSLCLTSELPPPAVAGEVLEEYDADLYDRQSNHLASVAEFGAFLGSHLGPDCALDIIDAPCGTGLAGPVLKPWAHRLVGLDLVPAMVSRAERLGCYDELIVGDLLQALPRLRADMVVCHGALYYFRDIAPIAAAVADCLVSRAGGGVLCLHRFPRSPGRDGDHWRECPILPQSRRGA